MAREAFGVICGWFLNERLMRIVARQAGKPRIAIGPPTAALLKAIRLKADEPGTGLACPLHDVRPCDVTSPAKVDRIGGGQIGRIHDRRRSLRVICSH